MKHSSIAFILYLAIFACLATVAIAQENVGPIRYNPNLKHNNNKRVFNKTTATLSLPFFEDFTGYSPLPDSNKWVDREVYINNTMPVNPISRGVATFDALNQNGIPYDTLSNTDFTYADSLTSQPINLDLGTVTPADSVYLSFFYQPQGNGFYPYPQDSLMLYLKDRYGNFVKKWSIPGPVLGSLLQPFVQIMIPITDSLYFHNNFQFRFVNIAASYWSDAVWNVDYIRLNSNRTAGDTTIADVAFSTDPTFLLSDYCFMPYSQFMANHIGEIAPMVSDFIINDTSCSQIINTSLTVNDITAGTVVFPTNTNTYSISGYQPQQVNDVLSISPSAYNVYPANTKVIFETQYFFSSTSSTGNTTNDTIIKQQVFDNYLAYDDGSAEKAYYLNLNTSGAIPGEIQIEYHLNHPDTLQGLAIYFARQVPLADNKPFFIRIYYSLIEVNGYYVDSLIYEQQYLFPGYIDTINHFWIYKLDTPKVLPAGTFYAGTVQPAFSGSDSLYFGLDVNRIGGNHAYFRVTGAGAPWSPSSISGAIMMRPIIGHDITSSALKKVELKQSVFNIIPNPAKNEIRLYFEGDGSADYKIYDMAGIVELNGKTTNGKSINIANLAAGVYFVNIVDNNKKYASNKLIVN